MIKRKIAPRRVAVIAAAAAAASFAGSAARAQTLVTWVGAPATPLPYTDGVNWSSGVTPLNANNEFLQINNGGIATIIGGQSGEGAFLNLGLEPTQSGHLQISGGTLTLGEFRVGGREQIIDPLNPPNLKANGGGTGTVLQTGGDVFINFSTGTEPPIQSLYIGDAGIAPTTEAPTPNTANGRYEITAGTLTAGIAADDAIVV